MKSQLIKRIFLLGLLLLLPYQIVLADTGPKPSMEFSFTQESTAEPLTITSGILYECDQVDCSDATPLEQVGPQRFTCESNSCYAAAYGFASYHKIGIEFSDGKTRQSNIFQTAGFDSKYMVTIRPDELLVDAKFSPGSVLPPIGRVVLLCACALVIGIALILALVVVVLRRRSST